MDGQQGKQMRRRHSTGSARFNELRGLFNRVTQGQRPSGAHGDEELRTAIAGDRRGTAAHRMSARKGGGQ